MHDGEVQVLLAHRPKYDVDAAQGQARAGETHQQAAVREVLEETGLRCERGPELFESHYADGKGRPKVVRYWMMTVRSGTFEVNDEVDEVRWLTVAKAAQLLSYSRDVPVSEPRPRAAAHRPRLTAPRRTVSST